MRHCSVVSCALRLVSQARRRPNAVPPVLQGVVPALEAKRQQEHLVESGVYVCIWFYSLGPVPEPNPVSTGKEGWSPLTASNVVLMGHWVFGVSGCLERHAYGTHGHQRTAWHQVARLHVVPSLAVPRGVPASAGLGGHCGRACTRTLDDVQHEYVTTSACRYCKAVLLRPRQAAGTPRHHAGPAAASARWGPRSASACAGGLPCIVVHGGVRRESGMYYEWHGCMTSCMDASSHVRSICE